MGNEAAKMAIVVGFVLMCGCSSQTKTTAPVRIEPSAAGSADAAALGAASAAPANSATASVHLTDIDGLAAQQAIIDLAALGVIEPKTGAFHPHNAVTRAEFVTWLVKANNAFYKDTPNQQIRLAEDGRATFVDVPPSNQYYKYIQGLANAGYIIGVDTTHFAPNTAITREQMIAIKASRDVASSGSKPDLSALKIRLPFTDVTQIGKPYWGPIYDDFSAATSNNATRVWGPIKTFHPQAPVERAEAALALSVFGGEIPVRSAAALLGQTSP